MKLKNLIRGREETKKSNIIALDYSHFDSEFASIEQNKKNKVEDKERNKILKDAREEAERIIKAANVKAEGLIDVAKHTHDLELDTYKKDYEEKQRLMEEELILKQEELQQEYEEKAAEVEKSREEIHSELESLKEVQHKEIYEEIFAATEEETIKKVMEECSQLIQQVHAILNQAVVRRREMISDFEEDMTELVLLIAQKVVKVISETDKNVVLKNLHQALKLLKKREHFHIRVNAGQLSHVKKHLRGIKEELAIEGKITVTEDTTVELGGCIIETELGEVDARISTQFLEIGRKIRDSNPIKNVRY